MTADIATRLAAAKGGDRELDARIHGLIGDAYAPWSAADVEYAASDPERTCKPPHYTSSLDAALALVEAKLPGWDVRLTMQRRRDFAFADISGPLNGVSRYAVAEAATPPLALLLALLDALAQPAEDQP
jgi:hypothetical protein